MKRTKHHESRNVEDHLGDNFATQDGSWQGREAEVHSDPLIDKGQGKPIVIRPFVFSKSDAFNELNPSKQELFDSHKHQMQVFLWKDGLEPIEFIPPRVVVSKDTYTIYVTAQAKVGVPILETPINLQDLTKSNANGYTT